MLKVLEKVKVSDLCEINDIAFKFVDGNYKAKACQSLIAFDIETSNGYKLDDNTVISFDGNKYNETITSEKTNTVVMNPEYDENYKNLIDNAKPVSIMYCWQVAIESQDGPKVFMGRTWDEYIDFMCFLTREIRRQSVYGFDSIDRDCESIAAMESKHSVSLKIYVHNLGFEFQHLQNVFEDELTKYTKSSKNGRVFARECRKPMKFNISLGKCNVEFRDSLVLTQKSLDNWCKDENLPVKKLKEDKSFYNSIYTPKTPLEEERVEYCINDVVSMLYGLEKYREKYETLAQIPLTQTGQVRIKCHERVSLANPEWAKQCLDITQSYTPEQFKQLCYLFQGGWTHGNKEYIGQKLTDIKCFDFASSYPAVMTSRLFPNGKFETCDISEFDYLESQDINNCAFRWYAKIKVKTMKSILCNTYWSLSKVCIENGKPCVSHQRVDNGKIDYAEDVTLLVTDLDWDTFKQAYDYTGLEIIELYKSEAGYLCKEICETILEYFQNKTSLKGTGNDSLYNESKQFINSIYGCSVTKIVTDTIEYSKKGWVRHEFTDEDFFNTVGEMKEETTFLAYQHGIWITSWARHNLWDFILKFDERIIYCDTDSIKGMFTEEDLQFVDDYNKQIAQYQQIVADYHGYSSSLYTATTSKGSIKRLGVMEREDDCEEFKTLGAKRYVAKHGDSVDVTIAGLPKSCGKKVIKSVDDFHNNRLFNTIDSDKMTAYYNDNQGTTVWTDKDGVKFVCDDKYGLCLKPTTFDLSMSSEFEKFLAMLATGRIDKNDEFFKNNSAYLYK